MAKMVELMKQRLTEIANEIEVCDKQCEVWNDKLASLALQRDLIEAKIAELEKDEAEQEKDEVVIVKE